MTKMGLKISGATGEAKLKVLQKVNENSYNLMGHNKVMALCFTTCFMKHSNTCRSAALWNSVESLKVSLENPKKKEKDLVNIAVMPFVIV